ncbi:Rv0623-like transcription factor [Variibacter gotjawalensis]|uniref:Rv0623-like transcription factor n=1 Tax=Variibacter gotjawalensis TaxID=1333996 RepID=A0A0S3PVM6_9BRAD|nr:type II toxin-antitoxin system VapB family antitoxin [Variibacter gotjawalensis]NIK45821.1 antitoxin VapB [Variibacter gotjawalensis]RZS47745.1 antitoxin VapB [Variibacter gotjawalensis]BAT59999.1 Rv0623-like transcription factor [Variibacter gotjawalensis]
MPLYVNDDEADSLAKDLQRVLKTRTKAAAVRIALQNELARAKKTIPLRHRIAKIQADVRDMGPTDSAFDIKAFTDKMWGDA